MTRVKNKFSALAAFLGVILPFSTTLAQSSVGAATYASEYEKLTGEIISVLVVIKYGFFAIAGVLIILALCQYLPANGDRCLCDIGNGRHSYTSTPVEYPPNFLPAGYVYNVREYMTHFS